MLDYARAAAEANGITNISFVGSNSRKFRPRESIDVILQEQMGIGLFDEGMLEALIDVRDRCLAPGGRILPAKFEFYLEPVQLMEEERIPLIQELRIHGVTFPRPVRRASGAYSFREIYPRDVDFLLCGPEPVFSFDLNTLTLDHIPKRFCVSKPVVRRGQLDGICSILKRHSTTILRFPRARRLPRHTGPCCSIGQSRACIMLAKPLRCRLRLPTLSEYHYWSWLIGSSAEPR